MNNNQYNSQANHDNRHWMIDLASLCESAARKDKAKVTLLLLQQQQQQQQELKNDDDNGLLRRHSNNNHHNNDSHNHYNNDIQASTKLMNLLFGNYNHNDNNDNDDDDTMYDILQYFSNVYILPLNIDSSSSSSSLSSSSSSSSLQNHNQEHYEIQKNQLLMSIRSLLLLPSHHPIPWDTIQHIMVYTLSTFLQQQPQQQPQNQQQQSQQKKNQQLLSFGDYSLFKYYNFDMTFALHILNDIKVFIHSCHDDISSMIEMIQCKDNYNIFDNEQEYDEEEEAEYNKDKIQFIENALYDIFGFINQSIFQIQQQENEISTNQYYFKRNHNKILSNNNNHKNNHNIIIDDQYYIILCEMIVLMIDIGKSIERYHEIYTVQKLKLHHQNHHHHLHDYKEYYDEPSLMVVIPLIDLLFFQSTSSSSLSNNAHRNLYHYNNDQDLIKKPKHQYSIKIEMIIPLLSLSEYIGKYMNARHWSTLRTMVYHWYNIEMLCNHQQTEHFLRQSTDEERNYFISQMRNIFQMVLSMTQAMNNDLHCHDQNNYEINPSWAQILVELFCASMPYHDLCTIYDFALNESIRNMPSNACITFIDEIVKVYKQCHFDNNAEQTNIGMMSKINALKGASLYILFIVLYCQQTERHQNIVCLISESLGTVEETNLLSNNNNILMAILSLMDAPVNDLKILESLNDVQTIYKSFFKSACYGGKGCIKSLKFDDESYYENMRDIVESMVQVCCNCFSFCEQILESETTDLNVTRQKSINWMQKVITVGQSLLECNTYHSGYPIQVLLGVSIFITLFEEIKSSRQLLMQHFAEVMSCTNVRHYNRENEIDPKYAICWILTFIVNKFVLCGNNVMVDEMEFRTEHLQPFCTMLNSDQSIPYIKSELLNIISIVPNGRKSIIEVVQQTLKLSRVHDLVYNGEYHGQFSVLIEGLLVLIQNKSNIHDHSNSFILDECKVEAVMHVSNLIVLQRPSIPSLNTSDLLTRLVGLIEKHVLCNWAAERLLAAVLIALLPHFRSNLLHQFIFLPSCDSQEEWDSELSLLTMIALRLFSYQSKNVSLDEIEKLVTLKRRPQETVSESYPSLRSIALTCLGAIIKYISQSHSDNEDYFEYPHASQYIEHLCKMEIKQIDNTMRCHGFEAPSYHNTYLNPNISHISHPRAEKLSSSFKFHPSVYDDLGKLLMDASETVRPKDEQTHLREKNVDSIISLLTYSSALKYVKNQSIKSTSIQRMQTFDQCDTTNVTRFFQYAMETMKYITKGSRINTEELHRMESLLNVIRNYCDSVQNCHHLQLETNEKTFISHIESIQAIWCFYNECCNEMKCCDLIDFIEVRSGRHHSNILRESHQNNSQEFPLHDELKSTEKIYDFIRKYRLSLISCLGSTLQYHQKQNIWKNNKSSFFLFCADVTFTLTLDLGAALNGVSGGMTRSLYRSYIQTIEDAVLVTLQTSIDSSMQSSGDFDINLLSDLKTNCMYALTVLWNVVEAIEVKNPNLFKSNFQLCLIHFPRLHRRIERIFLLNFPTLTPSINLTNGSDIAPEEKSIAIVNDSTHLFQVSIQKSKDKKKKRTRDSSNYACSGLMNTLASNPKLLEWTLESSIIMIEKIWLEAGHIVNDENSIIYSKGDSNIDVDHARFDLMPCIKEYAAKRLSFTSDTLRILTSLLSTDQDSNDSIFDHLSLNTKRRIYPCLERIFNTLKACIRFMSKHVEEIKNGSHISFTSNNQLSIAESTLCIVAWVTIPDFTMCIKNYYTMLSTQKKQSTGKVIRNQDNHYYSRMKRLIHKIEELERAHSQLYHTLNKPTHDYISKDLDVLVQQLQSSSDDDNVATMTMMQVIKEYIHFFSRENETIKLSTSNILNQVDDKIFKKRLDKARGQRKRSHNVVVDEWMDLDYELDDEENKTNNDNFDDLEDFIVPG